MVREAQSSKAPAQRLADLAGRYLVIVALAAGVITFAAWLAFGHQGVSFALSAAVAAVVIACPDALALATPTAITVGVGRAARAGVLFRNAAVLEAAARVDTVVFDKTGTLTEGRPSVTDIVAAGAGEAELLRLAAAADAQSEHPLATALVEAAKQRALAVETPSRFEAVPGHGVKAVVGGRTVLVGNRTLLSGNGVTPELDRAAERLRAEAKTALYVAVDGRTLGLIAVAGRIHTNEGGPGRRRSCARAGPPSAPQDQAESLLGGDLQCDRYPARCRRFVSSARNPAQAGVGSAGDERQHRDGYLQCAVTAAAQERSLTTTRSRRRPRSRWPRSRGARGSLPRRPATSRRPHSARAAASSAACRSTSS